MRSFKSNSHNLKELPLKSMTSGVWKMALSNKFKLLSTSLSFIFCVSLKQSIDIGQKEATSLVNKKD